MVRVREALPEALELAPRLVWESCGAGCEQTDLLPLGRKSTPAMATVVTAAGPRVFASFKTSPPVVRRFVDLRTGATVAALQIEPLSADERQVPSIFAHSPYPTSFILDSAIGVDLPGVVLFGFYDAYRNKWEFKQPWGELPAGGAYCARFVLDSNPPSLLFGCGAVFAMATPGSNAMTQIEGSENFGAGAGNAGLAAWSELLFGSKGSRIRTWSPEQGARVLVESMPGVACGIAVSDTRITGVRSGDETAFTFCDDYLPEPEFFSVSRESGEVTVWPVPNPERIAVTRATSWGDFAATNAVLDERLPNRERVSVWLMRLTDGKMRKFVSSPGADFRMGYLGLDDLHLYIGESQENDGEMLHRIVRYRLDHFDTIGSPLE